MGTKSAVRRTDCGYGVRRSQRTCSRTRCARLRTAGTGSRLRASCDRDSAILSDGDQPARRHSGTPGLRAPSLAALVRAVTAAAGSASASDALRALAEAARAVSGAEIALVRALDGRRRAARGGCRRRSAGARGRALRNRAAGGRAPAGAARRPRPGACRRTPRSPSTPGPRSLLLVPARADRCAVSVELLRAGEPFGPEERLAAELCAAQAALVLRAFAAGGDASSLARPALELAGEALAVALQEEDAAAEVVRLAAGVAGASAAVLWQSREDGLVAAASWGVDGCLRARGCPGGRRANARRAGTGQRPCRRAAARLRRLDHAAAGTARRRAFCSYSIARARSPTPSSSRGSRRSASAPRTPCAPASGRAGSRSSSSARARCSR